jgi:hypothetical protein
MHSEMAGATNFSITNSSDMDLKCLLM